MPKFIVTMRSGEVHALEAAQWINTGDGRGDQTVFLDGHADKIFQVPTADIVNIKADGKVHSEDAPGPLVG